MTAYDYHAFDNAEENEPDFDTAGGEEAPEAESVIEYAVVELDEPEEDEAEADVEDETEEESDAETDEEEVVEVQDIDEQLWDKANKAARLLRNRRAALQKEKADRGGRPTLLVRAIALLQLKPEMTQKEMSDLLGVKLRELDEVLARAEESDIVSRIEPDEPDMRAVVVRADVDSLERAKAEEGKGERFVPGLSDEDAIQLLDLLDQVINPLVSMGLDEDRDHAEPKGRGGRDRDRDDRGGRGGAGGGRGGYAGQRGGAGGGRGGFHGRDDRGGAGSSHGGYRGRDDRNGSGGYRGGNHAGRDRDDRGGRGGYAGPRGGYSGQRGRDDRGGYSGGRNDHGGSYRGNRSGRY